MSLVALNLLVLVWIYLSGDTRNNASREPQRILAQISPEKVRLQNAAVSESLTCRAFVAATLADAQKAVSAWSAALPQAKISMNLLAEAPVFDIVIAGIKNRQLAQSSLVQLRSLGLTRNGEIRSDGENLFAVVMATFPDRSAAELALKELSGKGLRLASVAERQPPAIRASVEVRGTEAALKHLPTSVAGAGTLTPSTCAAP